MGSVCRSSLAVVVMAVAVVAVGVVARQQQGPLTCWSCLAHTQGPDCYDLDYENMTLTKMCNPEEVFCTVNRIWYVVEAGAEARNLSVNRTCAADCSPSCVVIGDRTKIHSCTSCCTTSYCNVGSSASARPTASNHLVVAAALLLGAWSGLVLPRTHTLPAG
ncbi:hypothetical protein E2C01_001523 [Portunus trituberculatus]|uniref:Uncharacterized protein n=1 Tax=Portunus trituberculatus TaxID=210409 RepID=A0A5B7CKM9_PORTR|nr:hypothetical protein [Portunus trituberculatus]